MGTFPSMVKTTLEIAGLVLHPSCLFVLLKEVNVSSEFFTVV